MTTGPAFSNSKQHPWILFRQQHGRSPRPFFTPAKLGLFARVFGRKVKNMKRAQVIDLYFMEARAKLIDLAAFLDRVDRAEGTDDFRVASLRRALDELREAKPDRAKRVLLRLSDPTTEPLPKATTKAASGAWPGAA
jgi:hypothetical protein